MAPSVSKLVLLMQQNVDDVISKSYEDARTINFTLNGNPLVFVIHKPEHH